ncbi:hypothetical protein HanPI659440_Chr15g0593631 [Helianthus annuus]|nr:hypothetical protein HanPI659440_Chr15g0593631 [Helianthus annuus]
MSITESNSSSCSKTITVFNESFLAIKANEMYSASLNPLHISRDSEAPLHKQLIAKRSSGLEPASNPNRKEDPNLTISSTRNRSWLHFTGYTPW